MPIIVRELEHYSKWGNDANSGGILATLQYMIPGNVYAQGKEKTKTIEWNHVVLLGKVIGN